MKLYSAAEPLKLLFFWAVIGPYCALWPSLIIKIVFCTSVHPYIASATWVFSGQSLSHRLVSVLCLSCGCLSKPSWIPLGLPANALTVFSWLVQSFCKVLESFTIKTNLSTLYKEMPGSFSHAYEWQQLCFLAVTQAQLLVKNFN